MYSNTGSIRDDPYWTSRENCLELIQLSIRKNSLELIELCSIDNVSLGYVLKL